MSDIEIRQTYRLLESTAIRLGKAKKAFGRKHPGTTWNDFFVSLIEKKGPEQPDAEVARQSEWPGGIALSPRQQREMEAWTISMHPQLMQSKSFRAAFAGIKHAPYGPARAEMFKLVLEGVQEGVAGPSYDATEKERASWYRKQVAKPEFDQLVARIQWRRAGRSDEEQEKIKEELAEFLDPMRSATPTYGGMMELAGFVSSGKAFDEADQNASLPPPKPKLAPPKTDDVGQEPSERA